MDQNFQFPKILIGVAGGSASGKTTLCDTINNEMKVDKQLDLLIISVDSFQFGIRDYKGPIGDFNFDDPEIIDWDLLISTVEDLRAGRPVLIPSYDFVIHKRVPKERWTALESREIIFLEGIFALWHPKLRAMMNYKIFIDCDNDIRLCRRILRDINERGRQVDDVLYQCNRFVKPAYSYNIEPTKKYADIVVPGFKDNRIAVNLLVQQLKHQNKELADFKNRMTRHLVFFGDILHDIQICVGFFNPIDSEEDGNYLKIANDQLQRKVFFTNDSQKQRELIVFIRYLAKGESFGRQQFKSTLKTLLKYSLMLLNSALQIKKIAFTEIQCIRLDVLKGTEPLRFEKRIVIVVVPYLISDEDNQLLTRLLQRALDAKVQLIVVNFFAHIQNIMDMTKFTDMCFLINIFMLVSREKFKENLLKAKDCDLVQEGNDAFINTFWKQYSKYIAKHSK